MHSCVNSLEFTTRVEVPQGATVRELLEKIYSQKPALRGHDKSILVGAGLEFVDRNYKLNPGKKSQSCRRCKAGESGVAALCR